jgi:hypothetical protein
MAEIPALNVRINVDATGVKAGVQKATTAMKQLSESTDKDIVKLKKRFDDFGRSASRSLKIATAAVAAFAIKMGKDAVQGAMEDERQQIALATALRNTTGATDEAIAATVEYLDKLELVVGVDNNQLIPSLQILTQATKDVTIAQKLQGLALDISAGTTKDLGSVSLALAKAIGGNVGALTRLGVPLDANAVKAGDLNAIMKSLGETFAGQAEKRAQTFEFRLMKLKLSFNQIMDKLGYALIPILEKFANQLSTKILPQIQSFITLNEGKLTASLAMAAEFALKFLTVLIGIGNWIANNTTLVKNIAIFFAAMFVTSKVYGMITAINLLTAALVRMNIAMGAGGIGAVTKTAAKGGMLATLGTVLLGGKYFNQLGTKIAEQIPGSKANKAKTAKEIFGNPNFLPKSPSPTDVMSGIKATTSSTPIATTDDLEKWLKRITEELKKSNAKTTSTGNTVQYVTVYASDTNDIARQLAKAATNGVPAGSSVGASTNSSINRGGGRDSARAI